MRHSTSRRNFLRTAPLAVTALGAPCLASETPEPSPTPEPFQYFTAKTLADDAKALQAAPGNNDLVASKALPFAVVLTTETAQSAKEFEWHEGRDHILQIVDGATVYEVGGTPAGAHSKAPGEWNAPTSTGATRLTLSKGDMLTIPRNTPHKRLTAGSVTFILISPSGTLKA